MSCHFTDVICGTTSGCLAIRSKDGHSIVRASDVRYCDIYFYLILETVWQVFTSLTAFGYLEIQFYVLVFGYLLLRHFICSDVLPKQPKHMGLYLLLHFMTFCAGHVPSLMLIWDTVTTCTSCYRHTGEIRFPSSFENFLFGLPLGIILIQCDFDVLLSTGTYVVFFYSVSRKGPLW